MSELNPEQLQQKELELEPLTEAELKDIVSRASEIPEVRRLVEEVLRLRGERTTK